jgi:dihydropteroate synthase
MYFVKKLKINFVEVKNLVDAEKEIRKIGSDPNCIEIIAPKMLTKIIKVKNVILQDAIIIKQDMLSIGGEVAVPKNTFELHKNTGDILIIGTLKQLRELVKKLKRHYNRLCKIAEHIEIFIKVVK